MYKIRNIAAIIIFVVFLSGCGIPNLIADPKQVVPRRMPSAAESKYMETEMAGFSIDTKGALKVTYMLTLKIKEHPFEKLFLDITYDDPQNTSIEKTEYLTVSKGEESVRWESIPIRGLKASFSYYVDVFVYEDEARTQLVDQLKQRIQSSLSQAYLERQIRRR